MAGKQALLLAVLVLAGCATTRKVVVKPEEAARLNSSDWTVKSEPAATGREAQ